MPDPKEIIGEAGVKALADAGFTITPPKAPEPVRLVTMEESRERWDRFVWSPYVGLPSPAWGPWSGVNDEWRERYNAADDWLVRTVNRRIIEGLPESKWGSSWATTSTSGPHFDAYRPDLLHAFCGEGT